MDLIR